MGHSVVGAACAWGVSPAQPTRCALPPTPASPPFPQPPAGGVVRDVAAWPADRRPTVVTIGSFDGVHRGHQALLDAARALAGDLGVATVVALTFDPFPRDVMSPGHGVPAIQSLADRAAALVARGADGVVVQTFSRAFSEVSAEDFAHDLLAHGLGAAGVVVGWDFRFGAGRRGDAALLRSALGVPVLSVPALEDPAEGPNRSPVSSTRIRGLVREGDVAGAARLIGRPHEVVGQVVRGDARGRDLGFPTANVVPETPLSPAAGVYAVRVDVGDGVWRDGVANHGVRPTVGVGAAPLEVHLFADPGDLYGRTLRVALVARLRGERRFPDLDALRAQIAQDVAAARDALAEAG